MISPWTVYWITRLDGVSFVITLLWVLLLLASLGVGLFGALSCSDGKWDWSRYRRVMTTLVLTFGLASLPAIFVPTTKEMAAILILPRVANSETVQELGTGLKELAVSWLDELKPDLKKEK